jgi:hypothetical protein
VLLAGMPASLNSCSPRENYHDAQLQLQETLRRRQPPLTCAVTFEEEY